MYQDAAAVLQEIFGKKAEEIIKSQSSEDSPFFLYLAFQAPHYPLEVPAKYRAPCRHFRDPKRQTYCGKLSTLFSKGQKYPRIPYFAAMLNALDLAVGRVVVALDETAQYQNTIIVFNTDVSARIVSLSQTLHTITTVNI